ncbi:MAG: hypothetical protein WBE76_15285 [Terracidiphilus sp.]
MKIIQASSVASALLVALAAVPAFAGVTITAPWNSEQVNSPFTLSAYATTCSSHPVTTMGFSFDSSSDTQAFKGQSLDGPVQAAEGQHILHVKAWSSGGACVADVEIDVMNSSSSGSGSIVPSDAIKISNIEVMSAWAKEHDDGGPGSSSGSTWVVSSPSTSGSSREFVTDFSGSGDERYSVTYSDDSETKNFFYDVWVYLTSSSNQIGNLEFDTNQVMPNGQTAVFGVQCDGYSSHWAYTVNTGSADSPRPQWVPKSGTYCNPRAWSQYTWHHVQAYYSRDDSGWLTYYSVWLDGVEFKLDAVVYGGMSLGWGPMINTQFQVDGIGTGHATAYLENLNISRW